MSELDQPSKQGSAPLKGLLDHLYQVKRPDEVSDFLAAGPVLVELLMEAALHIGNHFLDAAVSLDLDVDPESGWEQVAVEIRSSLPLEIAFALLRALDDSWWLDNSPRASGRLCITLGF